ncbi:MAG: hypothetical protein MZV64_19395 [Ignavibacteriales bacterium]|nr:hypothetical protein [Ignavibacteriales bacterium]
MGLVEHVIDQSQQALGVVYDAVSHVDLFIVHGSVDSLLEHFRVSEDGVKRGAQFV